LKLLLLFGDAAVGKMTVGQELAKITGLRLFHNHMTIEPVLEVFGGYDFNVIDRLRDVFFEEFANSDHYGMIFTFMWAFDDPFSRGYVEQACAPFKQKNADIYYTELVAPQEIRLKRNATENRLKHKPSKRDIETSNQSLLRMDSQYRYVSLDGEIGEENYIKIDNSKLPPEMVAKMIKERFCL